MELSPLIFTMRKLLPGKGANHHHCLLGTPRNNRLKLKTRPLQPALLLEALSLHPWASSSCPWPMCPAMVGCLSTGIRAGSQWAQIKLLCPLSLSAGLSTSSAFHQAECWFSRAVCSSWENRCWSLQQPQEYKAFLGTSVQPAGPKQPKLQSAL